MNSTQRLQPADAPAWRHIADLPGRDLPFAVLPLDDDILVGTCADGETTGSRILCVTRAGEVITAFEGPAGSVVSSLARAPAAGDEAGTVYATLAAPGGGQVLRSSDGHRFEAVAEPGLGDPARIWVGPLAVWRGAVVAAAGTAAPEAPDATCAGLLSWSGVPGAIWQQLAPPGFDDRENTAVSVLRAVGDDLLAGTANPTRGFQLWQAGPDGAFAQRLRDGAYRYSLNACLATILASEGEILLGTGALADATGDGMDLPAAPELLALEDGGDWVPLIGQPRFSPDGLKVPAAMSGPGFGVATSASVDLLDWGPGGTLVALLTDRARGQDRPFGLSERGSSRCHVSRDFGESFAPMPLPGDILAAGIHPEGVLACLRDASDGRVRIAVGTVD